MDQFRVETSAGNAAGERRQRCVQKSALRSLLTVALALQLILPSVTAAWAQGGMQQLHEPDEAAADAHPRESVVPYLREYRDYPPPTRESGEPFEDYLQRVLEDGRRSTGEMRQLLKDEWRAATVEYVIESRERPECTYRAFDADGNVLGELRVFPGGRYFGERFIYLRPGLRPIVRGASRETFDRSGLRQVVEFEDGPVVTIIRDNSGGTVAVSVRRPAGTRKATPIEKAVDEHRVKLLLKGDGAGTRRCRLVLENQTDRDQVVIVPAFQTFLAPLKEYQNMVTTEETTIDVPAGKVVVAEVSTLCASGKNIQPPPAEAVAYKPGDHPDPAVYSTIPAIVGAVRTLEKARAFQGVPIAPDRRVETIAQLAVWREIGRKTADPGDDVTPASTKCDLLDKVGLKDGRSLTAREQRQLDGVVESILAAVDLTTKNARTTLSGAGNSRSGSG